MPTDRDRMPVLAPPGAGVSALERWVGRRVLLPLYHRRLAWEHVPEHVERQAAALLGPAARLDEPRLTRRVLVPRMIGLEDSSRHHSYAMVLEHLTIVGERATEIVVDLAAGRPPAGAVRTADLKPAGATTGAAAIEAYTAWVARFRRRVLDAAGDRQSPLRFEHPWFGPLDARRWLCFVPFHQAIHLRQARAIRRRL